MYSPGAVKVAVVLALPSAALSIDGFGSLNFTSAGPRWSAHVSVRSGRAPRPRPRPPAPPPDGWRVTLAERVAGLSVTQTVSVSGSPTVAEDVDAMPFGGPVKIGPFASKRIVGGVLPMP